VPHGLDQTKIYVPTDAGYNYYTELLQGYFEKLTRWWNITKAFEKDLPCDSEREYPPDYESYDSGFIVVQTPDGLAIRSEPPSLTMFPKNPDLVLRAWTPRTRGDISKNHISSHITFLPGLAGEKLLVDAENARIVSAEFTAIQFTPRGESTLTRNLSIDTELTDDTLSRRTGLDYREYPGKSLYITYLFKDNMLQITRGNGWAPIGMSDEGMSDAYTTHLFKTIDDILKRATSLTPQTENRAISEPLPALPSPRRPADQ